MKKIRSVFAVILALCLFLSGCVYDDPGNISDTTGTSIATTTVETTQETTLPVHIHSFSPATCTTPKTCTDCGTTEGEALGHSWENGNCTVCGKSDPNNTSAEKVWIPTKGGTKYHTRANCSNMIDPEQVTKAEAELKGFTPCKRCH